MARGLLVATGVVATVSGVLLLAGGAVVATTFGSDGRVSTAPARVTSSGVAVLVEGLTVDAAGLPVPQGVGVISLTARSVDGRNVFLATAPDDELDTYLTGAPYDVVATLAPGATATTRVVPGTLRPQPPVDADLWTASALGAPARLPAHVPDGTTLVVMRPDADPGVDAELLVTLEVDRAWPAALVALGTGLVLLLLGLLLLRLGLRREPGGAHSAVATAAPAATAAPTAPPPAATAVDASSRAGPEEPAAPGATGDVEAVGLVDGDAVPSTSGTAPGTDVADVPDAMDVDGAPTVEPGTTPSGA